MIILPIKVFHVDEVMAQGYDTIHVLRGTDPFDLAYTDSVANLALQAGEQDYVVYDQPVTAGYWYQFEYANSQQGSVYPTRAGPAPGFPVLGPLGVLSIEFVRATTDLPIVANLSDSKLAELIYRTELMLKIYGDKHCGFNAGYPDVAFILSLVGRTLLEELYASSAPSVRMANISGITYEKLGNYEYRRGLGSGGEMLKPNAIQNLLPFEMFQALTAITNCSTTQVTMITTIVFAELPGVGPGTGGINVRTWWDGTDEELFRWRDYMSYPGAAVRWIGQPGGMLGFPFIEGDMVGMVSGTPLMEREIPPIGGGSVLMGPPGPQGPQGEQGSVWYTGSGNPPAGLGKDGDFYLRSEDGQVFEKESGVGWQLSGKKQAQS